MADREKAILCIIDRCATMKCPTCHVRDACRQTGFAHYTAAQLSMINACARVMHDEMLAVGAFDLATRLDVELKPAPERPCGTCGNWAPCANKPLGLCGYTQGLTQAQDHACADDHWTPREGQENSRG